MTAMFGAASTTEDVLSGVELQGKRILVTGVSAGLGVETARSLRMARQWSAQREIWPRRGRRHGNYERTPLRAAAA